MQKLQSMLPAKATCFYQASLITCTYELDDTNKITIKHPETGQFTLDQRWTDHSRALEISGLVYKVAFNYGGFSPQDVDKCMIEAVKKPTSVFSMGMSGGKVATTTSVSHGANALYCGYGTEIVGGVHHIEMKVSS
jgi:hypothetical protein